MSDTGLWGESEFPAQVPGAIDGTSENAQANQEQPPAQAAENAADAANEPKFSRVIDLGDGSGVQRFEADTAEELLDKLADAQKNATQKIRALNARLKLGDGAPKRESAPPPTAKALSADEVLAIAEQLKSDPSKAFESLMASQVGMTPQELRAAVEDAKRLRAQISEQEHATAFIAAHPEYPVTQKNGATMQRYLDLHGLSPTIENLEAAFKDLDESGLLESKAQPTTTERTERIAPAAVAQRRTSQGALAPRNSARPAADKGTGLPSDEDARKMPLAELRARLVSHYVS